MADHSSLHEVKVKLAATTEEELRPELKSVSANGLFVPAGMS